MFLCESIRPYSVYGKRPAVTCFSGRTRDEWFKCNERLHSEACMMDLTWALVRMPPLKLFGVVVFPSEKKAVPGWSGFNAVVHSCVPVLTNIGYSPMIHGSPTEFWPRRFHHALHILPECVHSAEHCWRAIDL